MMIKKRILKTLAVMAVLLALAAVPALAETENGPLVFREHYSSVLGKLDPVNERAEVLGRNPNGLSGMHPDVTPDGKTVVYVDSVPNEQGEGRRELFSVPMDGGADPTQLTTSDPNIAFEEKVWPTVAPDGKTVYFQYSTHDGTSDQAGIYSVPIGGGDITPVIQDNSIHKGLQITPDGENFVYVDESGISVRPVGGGPATTLYAHDACKRNSGFQSGCGYPSISPDGTKVAFTDTTAVYTMPFSTTGGGTATMVPGSGAGRGSAGFLSFDLRIDETVSFSPDGRFIAYNALRLHEEIIDCGGNFAYCGYAETRWIPVEGGNYEGVRWADFTAATQVVWAPAADYADPTTTAASLPQANSAGWNNSDVAVTLSATDNDEGSGVEKITYSASGAQNIEQTDASGSSVVVKLDQEGTTTLTYYATDKSGNTEDPQTLEVKIDRTAPTANLSINSGDPFTNNTAVNLTMSDEPAPGSGVAQMRFSSDGTIWSEWEPFSTSKAWIVSEGDGEKTIYSQFKDAAGNESDTAQDAIGLDTAAPTATHAVSPLPNANGWNNSDVIVTLDAIDSGGSGIKEISYSVNGGAYQTYNPTAKIPVRSEGTTTISYFATDNAGNEESPVKTFTVKLDKSAPTLDTDNSDGSDGITPDKGQTGVRRNINPTATFSDLMDPASLRTSARLYRWNTEQKIWQQVPARVSVVGKKATLDPYPNDPTRLLAANTKFKVTITTGAKNLAGIPMSSSKSWTFTTGSR
jgi:hypothetical protein